MTGNTLPLIINMIKVLTAAILFYSAANGSLENKICQYVPVQQVIQSDNDYLKQSLASAMKHFAVLSALKGSLAMINDSEIFGISVGKVASPILESVNFLWRVFGLSMISMTMQIGLISFFHIIGIRVMFAGGAAVYAVSLGVIDIPRRIGVVIMVTGLIFFILMPYSVYMSRVMFEKSSAAADSQLSQSLKGFESRVDGIELFSLKNLRPKHARETAEQIRRSLSAGLDLVISAMIKYFSHVVLIFVITPLFFYGVLYLLIRKLLDCIGAPQVIVKLDEKIINAIKKLK